MKSWLSSKRPDILREAPEMKYVFIEKHQAGSASKQCAACSGWPAAAGIRVSAADKDKHASAVPPTLRQRVLAAFTRSKQRYGAPRLTDDCVLRVTPLT